jgi:hypothetical protein
MRIGASRELPRAGYYLCVDATDIDAAVRPLRNSAASLLNGQSQTLEAAGVGENGRNENWLPGMDSNHDSRLQRPLSYH